MTTPRVARDLPVGTVTFLRTDIEGSMAATRELGLRWDELNATHVGLVRDAVEAHGGMVVRTEGDAVFAAFDEAGAGVAAAVAAQRALAAHPWPASRPIRVRMGLHTGAAHLAGDDYGGFDVNRAARVAAVGHGGQVVVSETTGTLVADALPAGVTLRDLGSHLLKDVVRPERLSQLDIAGLPTEFPPLRTTGTMPGNLPERVTTFIGRGAELDVLARLVDESRLITLTGPGGIGKSSLGLEAARRSADRFRDGAWLVRLDEVVDPAQVTGAIAYTLGIFDGIERTAAEALPRYLADRSVLLVLDNVEHVIESAVDIARLLREAPGLRIIATSRAPLHIAAEREVPVSPLRIDDPSQGAVRLFVDRARAVRPGWEPGDDAEVVGQICALLDGLPLGVELAAARVGALPPVAIRDRLASHLPLPGVGRRDVPDRHRTLEATFAWSHDLMPTASQAVLHELAVFDGSFDLEQASAVVGPPADGVDLVDHLVNLVDQSLVARDTEDQTGTGIRFRLLGTIRGFALDRLRVAGREDVTRRRHAVAYLALAESAAPFMPSADQPRWLDRLTVDHANLRGAARWCIETGEVELALRFTAAMWRFWQMGGHLAEGTELAEAAMSMPGAQTPTHARLAAAAAAGGIAYWHGRRADSARHYEEELALAQELGVTGAEADATWNLAYERYVDSDPAGSLAMMDVAQRLFEEVGDERGVARVEWTRETIGATEVYGPDSLPTLEALKARMERLGDPWYGAQVSMSLAWAIFLAGDIEGSSRWFVRGLIDQYSLRDLTGTTLALNVSTVVAMAAERPEEAAALLGAFDALSHVYGVTPPIGIETLIQQASPAPRLEAALGPDRFAEAVERGRRMTLDEAVALVVRIVDETWGTADRFVPAPGS